jgi:hypothetical protein
VFNGSLEICAQITPKKVYTLTTAEKEQTRNPKLDKIRFRRN